MKRAILLLGLLLVPNWALAQVQLIEIKGPMTGEVNSTVELEVTGLPTIELDKTLKDLFAWTDHIRLKISGPNNDKPPLNSTIGFDLIDKKFRLKITFVPAENGAYVIALAETLSGSLNVTDWRVEVGRVVPNPPQPIPTPPSPIPDDRFNNVGKLAFSLASELPPGPKTKVKSLGELYSTAAEKLKSGEFINVTASSNWLQAERKKILTPEWDPILTKLSDVWNKNWPLDKTGVIDFYTAVSLGFKGVSNE